MMFETISIDSGTLRRATAWRTLAHVVKKRPPARRKWRWFVLMAARWNTPTSRLKSVTVNSHIVHKTQPINLDIFNGDIICKEASHGLNKSLIVLQKKNWQSKLYTVCHDRLYKIEAKQNVYFTVSYTFKPINKKKLRINIYLRIFAACLETTPRYLHSGLANTLLAVENKLFDLVPFESLHLCFGLEEFLYLHTVNLGIYSWNRETCSQIV